MLSSSTLLLLLLPCVEYISLNKLQLQMFPLLAQLMIRPYCTIERAFNPMENGTSLSYCTPNEQHGSSSKTYNLHIHLLNQSVHSVRSPLPALLRLYSIDIYKCTDHGSSKMHLYRSMKHLSKSHPIERVNLALFDDSRRTHARYTQ